MKAILLARVSDIHQDSHEAQINRLQEYVRRFSSVETFELTESSTKANRKKFDKVIERILKSTEPMALVVDTIDRLQRSFRESVMFDELRKAGKVEIHFYRENLVVHKDSNSSDLLRWDMGVMFARSYVLQLSDNVKRKFEQKHRNGEWTSKAPIGYLNIPQPEGKTGINIDTTHAPLIKKLFELYAEGNHSMITLADQMNVLGLKSYTGCLLHYRQIEHILKNPFYYGEMRIKDKVLPHKYEPIISKQLFLKAKLVRESWGKKPFKYASKPFVLRGLITCDVCECAVSPEIQSKYVYYSCTNYKKVHKRRVYVREEELLKPIREMLVNIYISKEAAEFIVAELERIHGHKISFHVQMIATLRSQYEKAQSRIDNLLDLYLDKAIAKDEYDKKLQDLKTTQQELLDKIKNYQSADENYYVNQTRVFDLAARALEIFETSELEEKRKILSLLLQNPRLRDKSLLFELRKPFDLLAKLNTIKDPKNGKNFALDEVHPIWLSSRVTVSVFKGFLETLRCSVQALGS